MKIKEFEFDEIIDERSNNKEIFDKSLKVEIFSNKDRTIYTTLSWDSILAFLHME
jgi:hypothetical protein